MGNYINTGAGLKKMFIAEVGTIICVIVMIIPIIGWIVGEIGGIVFSIISMVGLMGVSKDIEDCKKAFTLTIVQLVLSITGSGFEDVVVAEILLSIVSDVINFLIVYLVCNSVGTVLQAKNHADIAAKGEQVWKINLVCYAVSLVTAILAVIPVLSVLAGILDIVVVIALVVAGILYMIFLKKSYEAFGA